MEKTVQIIDEDQTFNPEMQHYLSGIFSGESDRNAEYKTISVFGSQSSGKSTLLNSLFGTDFSVMDSSVRKQTTHGIWMAKADDKPYLIFDVEGTDGRERGENQDFERKSALFSLAISQVLIINIWENSIGLYNGANTGLLKTVLDVHIQLFHKKSASKTTLLFVVRDFLNVTPIESLKNNIVSGMFDLWDNVSKSQDRDDEVGELFDFFNIIVEPLEHKHLQPERFEAGISKIRRMFYDENDREYLFKDYQKDMVPTSGLYSYTSEIWSLIKQNKDLDLPTQQELLAEFKCREIISEIFSEFMEKSKEFTTIVENGCVFDSFRNEFESLKQESLEKYTHESFRYNEGVVIKEKERFTEKLNSTIKVFFTFQTRNIYRKSVKLFSVLLEKSLEIDGSKFSKHVLICKDKVLHKFEEDVKKSILSNVDWSYESIKNELLENIYERTKHVKSVELKKVINNNIKLFKTSLDKQLKELLDSEKFEGMLDSALKTYENEASSLLSLFDKNLEGFELSDSEHEDNSKRMTDNLWRIFLKKLRDLLDGQSLLMRLVKNFNMMFRYDQNGVPKMWKTGDDIDGTYKKILGELDANIRKLSQIENININGAYVPSDTVNTGNCHFVLIENDKVDFLIESLHRETELIYFNTKKSMISTSSYLPSWIIVLLLVLGWNEFIYVLTSPIYLITLIIGGFMVFVLKMMNILPSIEVMANMLVNEARFKTMELFTNVSGKNDVRGAGDEKK